MRTSQVMPYKEGWENWKGGCFWKVMSLMLLGLVSLVQTLRKGIPGSRSGNRTI